MAFKDIYFESEGRFLLAGKARLSDSMAQSLCSRLAEADQPNNLFVVDEVRRGECDVLARYRSYIVNGAVCHFSNYKGSELWLPVYMLTLSVGIGSPKSVDLNALVNDTKCLKLKEAAWLLYDRVLEHFAPYGVHEFGK
jgi:hypothetical protein